MSTVQGEKRVRLYTPSRPKKLEGLDLSVLKKVAAYCRVSTDEADQINSYEVQKRKYNEHILSTPGWKLVGIYADRGISGTQTKNRDEFKRMIRDCKRGKIDLVLTKSVSRFARNNLDVLKYTRQLRDIGVDVYFEEQNIHSIDPNFDFLISLHGSLAQSESENLSKNVKWGKLQAAKEGKVTFHCKNFLGYSRNKAGDVEIDPVEAEAVKIIFAEYINGTGTTEICHILERKGYKTATGKDSWNPSTIEKVVSNEKYMGAVITNKTFVVDPISKKKKLNEGEVPQYLIENNHPAIVDERTFQKAQKEKKRRDNLKPTWTQHNKTQKGRYVAKNVLNGLIICGKCGTPYRRRTWYNQLGEHKYVWRCMKRVEYGRKYCKDSPTLPEIGIFGALEQAIIKMVAQSDDANDVLIELIKSRLQNDSECDNNISMLRIKIARLDEEFDQLINKIDEEVTSDPDMDELTRICREKQEAENELQVLLENTSFQNDVQERIREVTEILNVVKDHQFSYQPEAIRGLIARIEVLDRSTVKIIFRTGYETIEKIDLRTSEIFLPKNS